MSRKILLKSLKNFAKADEFKATYLKYLIDINVFDYDYISIVKNLLLLIEIPLIKESAEYKGVFGAGYLLHHFVNLRSSPERFNQQNQIKPHFTKNVDANIVKLLDVFTTNELIHWSNIESLYKTSFANSKIFADEKNYKNFAKENY